MKAFKNIFNVINDNVKKSFKRLHRLIHNNVGCVCKGNCVTELALEEIQKKKTKRKSK